MLGTQQLGTFELGTSADEGTFVFGQAQAQIFVSSTTIMVFDPEVYGEPVYSDTQFDTEVYGELTDDVASITAGYGQAQAQILAFDVEGCGQAQADIKQTYNAFAQCQADIKQTYQVYAQSQAQIINSYQVYGQAQALIIPTRVYGQSQADINQTYQKYSQAQSYISVNYVQVYGQAQAKVSEYYLYDTFTRVRVANTGLGTPDIGPTWSTVGLSSQTAISVDGSRVVFDYSTSVGFNSAYQSNPINKADIDLYAEFSIGNSDAYIDFEARDGHAFVYGDNTNTWYISTDNVDASASFSVTPGTTYTIRFYVKGIKYRFKIWATSSSEPTTWLIELTDALNTTAAGDVRFFVHDNSAASGFTYIDNINVKEPHISTFGQAQADIKTTYNGYGQAQAYVIKPQVYGQAQGSVATVFYFGYGQAQAFIDKAKGLGQAQAFILPRVGLGQAQAKISNPYNGFGQAQAFLRFLSYAQARAYISSLELPPPYFVAAGTPVSGAGVGVAGNLVVPWPAGHQIGDIGFLIEEQDALGIPSIIAGGAGFQFVAQTGQVSVGATGINLIVYWCRATSTSMTSPTLQGSTDHGFAQIITFRGTVETGTPFNFAQRDSRNQGADTVLDVFVDATANVAKFNSLFVIAIARNNDVAGPAFSRLANTTLASGSEIVDDGTTLGAGGGFAVFIGPGLAGSKGGTTTGTVLSSRNPGVIFALTPPQVKFGQAQAYIQGRVYGQAQGTILTFNNNRFGQAQGNIPYLGPASYSQAVGQIIGVLFPNGQAQARIFAFDYPQFGQANANIKTTYQTYAQAQAEIVYKQNGLGQAQARILTTYNSFGQVTALIDSSIKVMSGTARARIDKAAGYGQARAFIIPLIGWGQAQAQIKNFRVEAIAQARAFIINKKKQGQAQARINHANYRGYGQALANIDKGRGLGQAQAVILSFKTQQYAQAQGYILHIEGVGQAQAQIIQVHPSPNSRAGTLSFPGTYTDWGGSIENQVSPQFSVRLGTSITITLTQVPDDGGNIGVLTHGGGLNVFQSSPAINTPYTFTITTPFNFGYETAIIYSWNGGVYRPGLNGAGTYIVTGGESFGQAQAKIKLIGFSTGQAQASIRGNVYGMAMAHITTIMLNGYGQTQATIVDNRGYGQATALIDTSLKVVSAASMAVIQKSIGYGQAKADIKTNNNSIGFANAAIRPRVGLGLSQAYILHPTFFGQAQATLFRPWSSAQATALITQNVRKVAQAQAYIKGYMTGQAQAFITKHVNSFSQANAQIGTRGIQFGQAAASITATRPVGQAQAIIEAQRYLVKFNTYQLPGYVQEESMESVATMKTFQSPYRDISFSEYQGLENKNLSLRILVMGENYLDCKNQIELAATLVRTKKVGFAPLYIQHYDRHYEALTKSIKLEASTANIRTAEYSVDFECKPWLISDTITTVSGTSTIVTTGRTIDNGGWTPATVRFTGTNVTVSGYTNTGDFTGFITVSGTVTDYEYINEDLYIGPGVTNFVVIGATDCTITYNDRWYL